mgnify:CR=1 FL=1
MRKILQRFLVLIALVLFLAMPGWSAYAFTLDYATNDREEWTYTALNADTTGTLTFRNTNYRLPPSVFLVPNDADTTIDNTWLGTPTATQVVVTKTAGGDGLGRIIIMRRR